MRTTLEIDDDILSAAQTLARQEHRTTGQVLSALARRALTDAPQGGSVQEPESFCGFRPFASRGRAVSNELIDRLRDQEDV